MDAAVCGLVSQSFTVPKRGVDRFGVIFGVVRYVFCVEGSTAPTLLIVGLGEEALVEFEGF